MPSRQAYREVLQPRADLWRIPFAICVATLVFFFVTIQIDRAAARGLPPEDRLSQANVLQQLDHIRSYALVAERLGRGAVELHGGWFDVERADLHAYSVAEGRFIHVDERAIARALAQRASASS